MMIGYTDSRTLERRGCQRITHSKFLSILLPIKVFRAAGLNLLVELLDFIPIITLVGS